jgi:hypothetical protein
LHLNQNKQFNKIHQYSLWMDKYRLIPPHSLIYIHLHSHAVMIIHTLERFHVNEGHTAAKNALNM